ncbi:hypothetical protein MJO29_000284 [Puccinia striiformis f. sp. tritici]|uniref:AGC protein kinase n=1 Tax=Puccinia striiformis f. sp. tritici PST-78 TaxID=1165861 RepID=A0A0L0VRH7_9BASI|nr:hypothetical protein MJO29_000284 [Puccinia striiformis f. sp. tritici]KAI9602190.1 hypothetical protein KEM48_000759 [Puccinia striiformis f. sp. tritici PST-130]KNF01876.1 AGC protein kinase [Puccinia striiformis f. sp. tritici PST-78]
MACISAELNIMNPSSHTHHRSSSSVGTIGTIESKTFVNNLHLNSGSTSQADDWPQITVSQRNIKQKSVKIREPSFTLFVITPSTHLTLARTLEELNCFDQTLRTTYPDVFKGLSPPSILTSPMAGISRNNSTLRFGRSPRSSTPAMSSTSTLMPAAAPKPKSSKKHMFHSISRTLSPALSKSTARKQRSLNPALTLPTPPQSPDQNYDDSMTRTSSDPSDDDDFVEVKLSESEKQYVSQIEVGNERQENQLGQYLTNLAQRPLSSSRRESLQLGGGKRMSKLMRDAKEWQTFFKIGKDDFERERKLPKRDSHSLASSLKGPTPASVAAAKSIKSPDQDDGIDCSSVNASHPAAMKRVKSDQIFYTQTSTPAPAEKPSSASIEETSPPLAEQPDSAAIAETSPLPVSPIIEESTRNLSPTIEESSSILSRPIEESSSIRTRQSLEEELGLSAADADAINRLIVNSDEANHPQETPLSATSPPGSLPADSTTMGDPTASSVPASVVPEGLKESPAIVPSPADGIPTETTTSSSSPTQRRRAKITVDDFDIMRVLGKGCAGKVLMVKYRRPGGNHPNQVYAMKSIKKNHVLSHRELQHTLTEQSVLRRVADEPESNPFIVRLWWSFHDKDHLFLVMDFHPGGDLATQLARWGRLGRDRARFYAAEITEGVTSLHRSGVIYRDLKPENILIAFDGHIVLTDFGLSKQFGRDPDGHRISDDEEERTLTFCGTAEYLAPEVLLGEPYSYEVDWWSFGTMLFEMLTGLTPFWSEDHATMYRRVLHDELMFSEDSNRVMDHDTKTLLRGLLQRNPAVRMTGERIKKHPYFGMIDWDHVQHKRYIPPYVPAVNPNDATDTQNFDETFLAMEPTYVQDDDPPRPGTDEKKNEENEQGSAEDADDPDRPVKIEPQGAVDENGQDVFDGYSYRAPSQERDSIIMEDDEDGSVGGAGSGPEAEDTTHVKSASQATDSARSVSQSLSKSKVPSSHPSTTIVVNESEEPDLPTSNDEGEAEEDWDVVATPENGQSDLNGRLGKKPGNTLFARGVVDKYKLRMRKLNESSTPNAVGSLQTSSVRPFGSSRSSFIKAAQSQFSSVGNQSTISSINQASSEGFDPSSVQQVSGGSNGKPKKRFGLRTKKTGSSSLSPSTVLSELSPASPATTIGSSSSPSKKNHPTLRGIDLSNVGAHFLKKNANNTQLASPVQLLSPTDLHRSGSVDLLDSATPTTNTPGDENISIPGGTTINPKKKKSIGAGLI